MSNYPQLTILRTSATTRQGGQMSERATNGALKMRRMFATEKTDFEIQHALSSDQRSSLEVFYQAERDASISLWWPEDQATYTVVFAAPPQYLRRAGWWEARVRLSEV